MAMARTMFSAAVAAAAASGSLTYLSWVGDPQNDDPALYALNLTAQTNVSLFSWGDMTLSSLFDENSAYDWVNDQLIWTMQQDADVTKGVLLTFGLANRTLLQQINSTYCYGMWVDEADDRSLLCLTERPFWGPPLSATARAAGPLRSVFSGLSAAPPAAASAARQPRRRPSLGLGDAQIGYLLRVDRTTGKAVQVTEWEKSSVPCNLAQVYDRKRGIICEYLSQDDTDTNFVTCIDVNSGKVASNETIGSDIIYQLFSYDRVSGDTFGIRQRFNGSGWDSVLCTLDLTLPSEQQCTRVVGLDNGLGLFDEFSSSQAMSVETHTVRPGARGRWARGRTR